MGVVESGSFKIFTTSSSPDDSIRGAIKTVGGNVSSTTGFSGLIDSLKPASRYAKYFDRRFAKSVNPSNIATSISGSSQFRGFPLTEASCPLGVDCIEVFNPGNVNIVLEAIFLGSLASGSITSASAKSDYWNFDTAKDQELSSTASPGSTSTFEGWGDTDSPESIFTSSLTLNYFTSASEDFYAFFSNKKVISQSFCSHSKLADAFDVCFACVSSSLGSGPINVYFTGSEYLFNGLSGSINNPTTWFLDEALTVSASEGKYYPYNGVSAVYYYVSESKVISINECPDGNFINC